MRPIATVPMTAHLYSSVGVLLQYLSVSLQRDIGSDLKMAPASSNVSSCQRRVRESSNAVWHTFLGALRHLFPQLQQF